MACLSESIPSHLWGLITLAIFPPQRSKYGYIWPDLSLVTMPHNFSLLMQTPIWMVFRIRIARHSYDSLHGYASVSLGMRSRCLTESHFMGPLLTHGGWVNVICNSDGCSICLSSCDVHEVENAPLWGLLLLLLLCHTGAMAFLVMDGEPTSRMTPLSAPLGLGVDTCQLIHPLASNRSWTNTNLEVASWLGTMSKFF